MSTVITENAKEFWDAVSKRPNWIQYILPKRTAEEFVEEGRLQAEEILSLFALSGGTVIDYGCGIGRISRHMAKHADRMIGMDICAAFLDRARQQDGSTEYVLSDAFTDQNVADFVYSIFVMQHNTEANVKQAMASIHRMLKPGATCLVSFASGPVYSEGDFIHKFCEAEVRGLASGFSDVTIIKSNLVRYGGYEIPDGQTNEIILVAKK